LYHGFQTAVIRTPLLPFGQAGISIFDKEFIKHIEGISVLSEAIYLSSPSLYNDLLRKDSLSELEKDKQQAALVRYCIRAASRPTPYGLFAGCTLVALGASTEIVLDGMRAYRKNIRLDMHFLGAFAQGAIKIPAIRNYLLFFPNNSVYRMGSQFRYIQHEQKKGNKKYHIAATSYDELLNILFHKAKTGSTLPDLADMLAMQTGQPAGELKPYLDSLVEGQLLVSELEPAVTGTEPLDSIHKILEKIPAPEAQTFATIFSRIKTSLKELNETSPGLSVAEYEQLMQLLKETGVKPEDGKVLQADMFKPALKATIGQDIAKSTLEAIQLLVRLTPERPQTELDKFQEAFRERYEEQEIPLLTAVDGETGIGYPAGKAKESPAPLADDLYFLPVNKSHTVRWGKRDAYLLRKYLTALPAQQYSVELDKKEIEEQFEKTDAVLTDTFSAMISLVAEKTTTGSKEWIRLISAGGQSATCLLGRFCHIDNDIFKLCKEITQKEQELHPQSVIAEIVHLPENRLGNILQRPVLSEYEIPYIGRSSLSIDKQITVDDLLVSVENNRIVLRSKRLNKEVIPRLSSAHNFSANSLPVYHFLCELQIQDRIPGVGFDWGALSGEYEFLPRVTFKNVILSPASWNLKKERCKELLESREENLMQTAGEWRQKLRLPRQVVFVQGDQELVFDLENTLCLKTFKAELKKHDAVMLHEFIFDPDNCVVKSEEGSFTNQVILSYYREPEKRNEPAIKATKTISAKRTFLPGDEWLFYKIYAGGKSCDMLLEHAIKPLVGQLQKRGNIQKWFFIRYAEPQLHIRLRLNLNENNEASSIMNSVTRELKPYVAQGFVSKMQLDTYTREIERYGGDCISIAEQLFWHDSESILELLPSFSNDESKSWKAALLSVDYLLNDFGMELSDKQQFTSICKNSFAREFGLEKQHNKEARLKLDKKYREHTSAIREIFRPDKDENLNTIHKIFEKRSKANKSCINELQAKLSHEEVHEIIGSFVHMSLNRIFSGKQRLQEMIIYDFLSRYYTSVIKHHHAETHPYQSPSAR